MSGLRFAFLTTFYPPWNFGGDGIGIQRLARGLVRAGDRGTGIHDHDAYRALHRGADPAPQPEPEGLEVVSLRSGAGVLSPLLTQQLGRPVLNGPRISRLLGEGKFDVINFHNVSLVGGPGLFKVRRRAQALHGARALAGLPQSRAVALQPGIVHRPRVRALPVELSPPAAGLARHRIPGAGAASH